MNIIHFNESFSQYSLLRTDKNNSYDAMECFIETNETVDMVSYKKTVHMKPFNIGFIHKDDAGKYFVEVDLPRESDLITNINFHVIKEAWKNNEDEENGVDAKVYLHLNDDHIEIDPQSILLPLCSMYTKLQLKVVFETEPLEFQIHYDTILCRNSLRKHLLKSNVMCSKVLYTIGTASYCNA